MFESSQALVDFYFLTCVGFSMVQTIFPAFSFFILPIPKNCSLFFTNLPMLCIGKLVS